MNIIIRNNMTKQVKRGRGRPPGSTNLATREAKGIVLEIMDKYVPKRFWADFDALEPKDRISAFLRLLEFGFPRYKSIDATIDTNVTMTDVELSEYEEIKKTITLK